jgi:hypothetical protein
VFAVNRSMGCGIILAHQIDASLSTAMVATFGKSRCERIRNLISGGIGTAQFWRRTRSRITQRSLICAKSRRLSIPARQNYSTFRISFREAFLRCLRSVQYGGVSNSLSYHGARSQLKGSPKGKGPTAGELLLLASSCRCRAQELRDARPRLASPNLSEGIEMVHRADCTLAENAGAVRPMPVTSNIQGIDT